MHLRGITHGVLGAALAALCAQLTTAPAQTTVFTCERRLTDGVKPASGTCDLRFAACDASEWQDLVAGPLTNSATAVGTGLFTVALDFGSVFDGNARWLEIGVRTDGGGSFTTLVARRLLTPSPYALHAANAGTAVSAMGTAAGVVSNLSLLAGAVTSDKIADGTIAAADLSPALASITFWRLGGNAGTSPGAQFLGTADNQPLELRFNNIRALRVEPTTPLNAAVGSTTWAVRRTTLSFQARMPPRLPEAWLRPICGWNNATPASSCACAWV